MEVLLVMPQIEWLMMLNRKKGQTLGYGSKGVKSIIKIWIIVWIYIQVAAIIISESWGLQIDLGGTIFSPFEP